MLIFDMIAASANEGLHSEMIQRYLPKQAAGELDLFRAKIGARLYLDCIWEERIRDCSPPPRRSSIAWPIKRISNIVPLRRYVAPIGIQEIPGGFWNP